MKRRSKLSIQVYRAITVTAIGLMIGAAPMRVMTVQAQEIEKNQNSSQIIRNWTIRYLRTVQRDFLSGLIFICCQMRILELQK